METKDMYLKLKCLQQLLNDSRKIYNRFKDIESEQRFKSLYQQSAYSKQLQVEELGGELGKLKQELSTQTFEEELNSNCSLQLDVMKLIKEEDCKSVLDASRIVECKLYDSYQYTLLSSELTSTIKWMLFHHKEKFKNTIEHIDVLNTYKKVVAA